MKGAEKFVIQLINTRKWKFRNSVVFNFKMNVNFHQVSANSIELSITPHSSA